MSKKKLRKVQVFRAGQWRRIRLRNIRKGEEFRFLTREKDLEGKKFVASAPGFTNQDGIGQIAIR